MFRKICLLLLSFICIELTAQTINDTLIGAAEKGDTQLLLKCIRAKADVNYKTPYDSVTAIMFAADQGHYEAVNILLSNGADPNIKPWNGNTALHAAVSAFEFDIAELLIRNGAEVNIKNNDSITPLMQAASSNDWMMCDMLIYYDAKINIKHKDGSDALNIAALKGNYEVCELLIARNADVNTADNKGYTPLYGAAQNGHIQIFKMLYEKKADLLKSNIFGNSPIDAAIMNDQINILKFVFDTLNIDKAEYSINNAAKKKALVNNSGNLIKYLKSKQLDYKWPFIEKIGFTYNNHWNFHDYMMGGAVSLHDINYNFALYGGVDARLAKKRVLVDYDRYYMQYWEQRTSFYAELRKNWSFKDFYRGQLGAYSGIKATTSSAKYLGTYEKPLNVNSLSPHFGFYLDAYYAAVNMGYEYIDYNTEKLSPHKINIGFTFFIHYNKKYYRNNKTINWL